MLSSRQDIVGQQPQQVFAGQFGHVFSAADTGPSVFLLRTSKMLRQYLCLSAYSAVQLRARVKLPYCKTVAERHLTLCSQHAGVDMLVDVHGDEELPYCFIAGSEGVPAWGERMQMMQVIARGQAILQCTAA